MAVYKIFPTKDSTMYSLYPSMNTGLDEIIEVSSTTVGVLDYSVDPQVSRFLIQFSSDEITDVIDNKISTSPSFKTYFRAFNAKISGLNLTSSLEIYPISGRWGMSTGRYIPDPTSEVKKYNGTSWTWRNYSGSSKWQTTGTYGNLATASFTGSNPGGGNWYTGSGTSFEVKQSQSFAYSNPLDIKSDVTDTIHTWYSGTLPNDGFIIKQADSQEFIFNSALNAEFKFFSIDTHTIYPPQLEFRWYDYDFNTGSSTNTIISISELYIASPNNTGVFYSESIQRFRLNIRPKYPTRVFQTSSVYTTNYYLPESQSLYAIKDLDTNEFVIDFDSDYTRISADATSSYFDIYMNGLEPERYYTVLVKTVVDNNTLVINDNINFKVSNG